MRRRLLLLGALGAAVWALVVVVLVLRLAADLRAGRTAAERARAELGAEEVAAGEPLPELRVAADRFGAAEDRAGGILLAPLRILPVVGRQLRSVDALAGAAAEVASAGVEAVEEARTVFEDPAGEGSERVAQVRELAAIVDRVAGRLGGIEDLGPVEGLVGSLADARNELAADLEEARRSLVDARAGANAALALVEGPRRYLVLAANNAEMRAGSGMWLQGGVLTTDDGRLDLEPMRSLHLDADPPDGAVVPTGDLADRWGFLEPGNEWRNLMASPDFPASAELAVAMWQAAGRGEVDGVLALDAIGLQAIVEATGPVQVGDRMLGAEDVPAEILHDQYLQLSDATDQASTDNAARRETLSLLAAAAVDAIDRGDFPASTLIRTLGDAIAGRHLLAWSTDPVEQAGWAAAGMSGELRAEDLLVSVLNQGGNKLDWFLEVDADLDVEVAGDGWDVTVALTLRNHAPATGEPRYVVGPHPGLDLEPAEYRGTLAVNVPGRARDVRFAGVDSLVVGGRDGPTAVAGFTFDLPRGERLRATLRFSLPGDIDRLDVRPSARFPVITWRYGSSRWEDSSSRAAKFGSA